MIKNEKGFTVIELVLVMAISALLLIPIGSLLISNTRSIIFTTDKTDVQEKAMNVMASFRTNSTYAKAIKSLTVNGYNWLYDNTIPSDSSYQMSIVRPTLSSGDKEAIYEYDSDNKTFKLDGDLIAEDVVVDIIPLFSSSTPISDRRFETAVGIMVDVSISRENTAINRTSTINDLSNTFYFRNSGVDFNSVELEDAEGSAAPTPIPVPTFSPGPTTSASPDAGDGDDSGDSGDSGDITPTTSPTIAPTASPISVPTTSPTVAPTATPTPVPTPTPTVAPTPTPVATESPETGIGMTVNYDGSTCTIYDKDGNVYHTYSGNISGTEFTFNPYWTSFGMLNGWSGISSDDYSAFGLLSGQASEVNVAFTGTGTGTVTVTIPFDHTSVNIINASGCTITINNTACSNVYVTGTYATNYQVAAGETYTLAP